MVQKKMRSARSRRRMERKEQIDLVESPIVCPMICFSFRENIVALIGKRRFWTVHILFVLIGRRDNEIEHANDKDQKQNGSNNDQD